MLTDKETDIDALGFETWQALYLLLELGLVEHHLDKTDVRKEWYSITEKGKKIINYLENLTKLINLKE